LQVNTIREKMRQRRRSLGVGAQIRAAYQLAINVFNTEVYHNSRHIAFYLSTAGEIDLGFVLSKAWAQGKTCYLPVIDGERLLFVNYSPSTQLVNNRFGILEPASGGLIAPHDLELVLTPLVAFDKHCHRIGMGGGFYDKTFAHDPSIRCQAYMMGVAHYFQQVNDIDPQPWDVDLNDVVTS